jgi:uncharacterized membrane protein
MPLSRDWLRRVSWQTLLVALVAGGIIHISATLIIPQFAKASAFQRLTAGLQPNRMRILPPATADSQPLPFIGPDERLAVCHYNVTAGPVEVAVVLPDRGWTLAIYAANGDNLYLIPAQDMRRLELTLTLVPQAERFLGFFSLGRQADVTPSQVSVPGNEGLIVVRAPIRGRAYAAETESALARADCRPKRL